MWPNTECNVSRHGQAAFREFDARERESQSFSNCPGARSGHDSVTRIAHERRGRHGGCRQQGQENSGISSDMSKNVRFAPVNAALPGRLAAVERRRHSGSFISLRRIARRICIFLAAFVLVPLVACTHTPVGEWYVNTFEPSTARGSFEHGKLTLNRDHTFVASAHCAGKSLDARGLWSFDGHVMTFRDQSGSERRYPAAVVDKMHMKMYAEVRGSDVVAVFKRPQPRKSSSKEASP